MPHSNSPLCPSPSLPPGLRGTVAAVALANLGYFFIEFVIAQRIGSVSLFADSIDFLEDAAVNALIFAALGLALRWRARAGRLLAFTVLVPAVFLLWTAWQKFVHPVPPEPAALSATAVGALVVNLGCALALARHRRHGGSLSRGAFLSARNDVLANLAIMAAAALTWRWPSAWPDLVVGLGIAALNIDAAREIWEAADEESGLAHSRNQGSRVDTDSCQANTQTDHREPKP